MPGTKMNSFAEEIICNIDIIVIVVHKTHAIPTYTTIPFEMFPNSYQLKYTYIEKFSPSLLNFE